MAQPAYRDVADSIRRDIAERRLVEGDKLPTVRELAARYGVPTGTVAKAVDVLRAEGVIVSRHGNGVYVRQFARIVRASPGRLSRRQWGTGHSIQDHDTGSRLRVKHVDVREVPVPDQFANAMGVPAGAAVLMRARKFAVDDRVVQLATSYLPLDVMAAAPAIAYTDPGPGGIYARMGQAGLGPQEFTEDVLCRPPSAREAGDLDLPSGVPVAEVTRYAYHEGRCVEVNVMVLDSSAYLLRYQFTAE